MGYRETLRALAGAVGMAGHPNAEPARPRGGPRPAHTYRGHIRNVMFGRKPVGNTKPEERRAIWRSYGVTP